MDEPSREFAELAAIVAELAAVLESAAASPHTKLLRQRAETLAARVSRGGGRRAGPLPNDGGRSGRGGGPGGAGSPRTAGPAATAPC